MRRKAASAAVGEATDPEPWMDESVISWSVGRQIPLMAPETPPQAAAEVGSSHHRSGGHSSAPGAIDALCWIHGCHSDDCPTNTWLPKGHLLVVLCVAFLGDACPLTSLS